MNRDYLKFMTSDLLMQFRNEKCSNNRALISALARQLDDLFEMFGQLNDRTYLRLLTDNETGDSLNDGAHGIQLDRIGEVVDLTRKQATLVSNKIESVDDIEKSGNVTDDTLMNFIKENFSTYYPEKALEDPEYSEYLYYKIFLNSSYCTYGDVIKSLGMFWNKTPIYYGEKPEEPATMFLSTPELKPEQNARLFFLAPVIKAAGVRLFREAATVSNTETATVGLGSGVFSGVIQTKLPYLVIEQEYNETLVAPARLENIVYNSLDGIGLFTSFKKSGYQYAALKEEEYNRHSTLVYPAMYEGIKVTGIWSPYYENVDEAPEETTVKEIVIPSTVRQIGGFNRFKALETVQLPSSVTSFKERAFAECTSLKTVVLNPNSYLYSISKRCFEGCSALREIVIPSNCNNIQQDAFSGCNNLKKVIFAGTQKKWEKIRFYSGNDCIKNAEIECLGGQG